MEYGTSEFFEDPKKVIKTSPAKLNKSSSKSRKNRLGAKAFLPSLFGDDWTDMISGDFERK